jgi:hypothetical protein
VVAMCRVRTRMGCICREPRGGSWVPTVRACRSGPGDARTEAHKITETCSCTTP